VAAAEIHKAGQRGADAAKYLFWSIGFGTLIQALGELKLYAVDNAFVVRIGQLGKTFVRLGPPGTQNILQTGAISTVSAPTVSPAGWRRVRDWSRTGVAQLFRQPAGMGRAGPADDVLHGPALRTFLPPGAGDGDWAAMAAAVWRYIIRPVAVGSMMVGAAYTLIRMGKKLTASLGRALAEVRHGAPPDGIADSHRALHGFEDRAVADWRGIPADGRSVFLHFGTMVAALVAAVIMLIVGFFFATVSAIWWA
jgi:hypothetical protein